MTSTSCLLSPSGQDALAPKRSGGRQQTSQELLRLIAETVGESDDLSEEVRKLVQEVESYNETSWKQELQVMFEEVLAPKLEEALAPKLEEAVARKLEEVLDRKFRNTGTLGKVKLPTEQAEPEDVKRSQRHRFRSWSVGQLTKTLEQPRSVTSKSPDTEFDGVFPQAPQGNEEFQDGSSLSVEPEDPFPMHIATGHRNISSHVGDSFDQERRRPSEVMSVVVVPPDTELQSSATKVQPLAPSTPTSQIANHVLLGSPREEPFSGSRPGSAAHEGAQCGTLAHVPRAWQSTLSHESNEGVRSSYLSIDLQSQCAESWHQLVNIRNRFARRTMVEHLPARFEQSSWSQMVCATIVMNPRFDWVVSVLILSNAVSMGVSADYEARHQTTEALLSLVVIDKVFFALFLIELLLRLNVFRCQFFYGQGWGWNLFDFSVVGSQLIEEVLFLIGSGSQALGFTGVLRLLRIVRVIRLARILRLIRELRVLVSSISNSMKALVWTVILMFLMIYSVSLCITQLVSDHRLSVKSAGGSEVVELDAYYGSLSRSMLSMFEAITGGVDWDVLVTPLLQEVHPLLALLFVIYVAVALLAIMNVVTGVFVDSVLASARSDKESFLLNNAKELFKTIDEELDWNAFQGKMDNPQMMEFFKGIDVDPAEAKEIFSLIDLDESGSINASEFLNGCIRLQGPSKALETAVLLQEVRSLRRDMLRMELAVAA